MRLGGQVFLDNQEPQKWIQALKQEGYRAAICPIGNEADDQLVNTYRALAEKEDIVIAEVGAWSNPISPDPDIKKKALEHCKKQLDLAERIGARCCVNIAGSRGQQWDGPHPDNFSDETFGMIVDTVREIIDAVKPKQTYFTLETMPWVFPDSADSYLALIKAINRDAFAVHLDPVNMISSPRKLYNNAAMMKEFFEKLGPYIKNCHAKDIQLAGKLTVHLDEVIPGTGSLDYKVFLREIAKLDRVTPLIIEHLSSPEEYRTAAKFIRKTAEELEILL